MNAPCEIYLHRPFSEDEHLNHVLRTAGYKVIKNIFGARRPAPSLQEEGLIACLVIIGDEVGIMAEQCVQYCPEPFADPEIIRFPVNDEYRNEIRDFLAKRFPPKDASGKPILRVVK